MVTLTEQEEKTLDRIDEYIREEQGFTDTDEIGEPPVGTGHPPVLKLLTFPEAIAEAAIGKSIQRLAWPENEFGYFKDEFLCIRRNGAEGYKDYIWQVSKGDAVEEDWISF